MQLWHPSSWYNTRNGQPVNVNVSGVVSRGHRAIRSDGWYLGPTFDWRQGYVLDPATNETCSFPDGVHTPNSHRLTPSVTLVLTHLCSHTPLLTHFS